MQTLQKNWSSILENLFGGVKSELTVSTPFISDDGVKFLIESVSRDFKQKGFLRIITNLSPRNITQKATNPFSFTKIYEVINLVQIFHLPNLHAKVYIRDNKEAIITSGNLTSGGLYKNFEYGISIIEDNVVKEIRNDLTDYGNLGTLLDKTSIHLLCEKYNHIYDKGKIIDGNDVMAIENNLLQIKFDNVAIEDKAEPINAIFAKTIEYILKKNGPLKVTEIHNYIATIHPDICVEGDRICNGVNYGSLWKHKIRTALVTLNKQSKIEHLGGRGGIWQLINNDYNE